MTIFKGKGNHFKCWLALLVVMVIAIGPFGSVAMLKVSAEGTTYYVDSVGGSDSASGKSENAAWKTLDKVNSVKFSPGDSIRLKGGSVFIGQLYPKGSGTASAPITIDMYGGGQKPMILADGRNNSVVTLFNQEYWEINNLDVTSNNNTAVQYGINIIVKDYGTANHIYIRNCYVHDIAGNIGFKATGGIFLTVSGTAVKSNFNDVRVENNTVRHVDRTGITLDAFRSWENKLLSTYEAGTWYPSTNVAFRGNFVDDIGGDGIVMKNCVGGVVEYNTAKNCNARATDANVAVWVYNSNDCIMQYNEAYNTRYTHDGEGFDVDSFSENTLVQYNYSHDNEGGFMLVCAPGDESGIKGYYTTGTTVRYNISQNDGNLGVIFSGNITDTKVYNNTIYIGQGSSTRILDSFNWGAWPRDILVANNLIYNLGTGEYVLGQITDITFSNNLMYGNHPMSEPQDPGKITADPQLVAPGSGGYGLHTVDGYMLKEGSPALGAGAEIPDAGSRDYFGFEINGSAPNIGAYGGAGVSELNKKGVDTIDAGQISYIYPVYASAETGREVNLPAYIPVKLSSGRDEMVKVTWEEAGPFAAAGAYSVKGALDNGTGVVCDIGVTDPLTEAFEKISVTTNVPEWESGGDNKSATYIDPMSYSGKYCLTQYDRIPFNTSSTQTVEGLENGTYEFTAYVSSNGTQNKSSITVNGDESYTAEIGKTEGFQLIKIEGIQVSEGKCQVVIATDGQADSWIKVDECSLVKTDSRGVNVLKNSGFDIFDASTMLDSETKRTFAIHGTPEVDGEIDSLWEEAVTVDVDTRNFTHVSVSKTTVSATAKLMWDSKYLYILAEVKDPVISTTNQSFAYFRDSVEVVIDERNVKDGRSIPFNETCGQWRVGAKEDDLSGYGPSYAKGYTQFKGASAITDTGYRVEMAVPFSELKAQVGSQIGFEIQVNDDNGSGSRTGIVCWNSASGESWQYTDVLGTVILINDKSQMDQFAAGDSDLVDADQPDAEENEGLSRYTPLFAAAAVAMLLLTGANMALWIVKSKKR